MSLTSAFYTHMCGSQVVGTPLKDVPVVLTGKISDPGSNASPCPDHGPSSGLGF